MYFGSEVEDALLDYLDERSFVIPEEGHEKALFLSLQKKRIAVRSVENLVKKIFQTRSTFKKRLPHINCAAPMEQACIRKPVTSIWLQTFWDTQMLTLRKKHYAALEDERRRSARNKVKLREKNVK